VEFLVDSASGAFHFLELNATLGDEYAVTEAVTGTDLCLETLRVAAGLPLGVRQTEVRARRTRHRLHACVPPTRSTTWCRPAARSRACGCPGAPACATTSAWASARRSRPPATRSWVG
jgi:acetyl-CoA carboxylase biotin carboxylase subunit